MKKHILSFSLVFTLLGLFSNNISAQFSISGEFRPRAEFRNGYKKLADTDNNFAAFISQRSRLALSFKNEKITTKLSFQDVRVWGDETFKTDVAGINLYEAWVEMPICDSLSMKFGKQELIYDNERFLSNTNWQQLGYTHNAIVFKYKSNGLAVHLGGAFNQSTENYFGTDYSPNIDNYKSLTYLWASDKLTDEIKISVLAIADGYQKTGTTNTMYLRGTYGCSAEYAVDKKYGIVLRGFYQNGKLATGQEVAAYYGKADINYFVTPKLNLIVGAEYISGTDATDTANKKSNVFNTLYGTGHKFNGNMDYFTNMPKDTKGAGLINPYLSVNFKLSEKSMLIADFHYFMLQNKYIFNNKTIDKGLGEEIDLSIKHDFSNEVSLLTGISALQGTESLSYITGGNYHKIATWAFAMLTVKPTFFKSEKK
jgi:hypothetical protein